MDYQCEIYCCQIIMYSRNYSHRSHKLTKKEQDLIHRFTYHSVNMQQAAQQIQRPNNNNETTHLQATFGTNHYHSFQITRDSYNHQSLLDSKSLAQLAQEYLKPLVKKSHQNPNPAVQQYRAQSKDVREELSEIIVVQEKKNQNCSDKYFQKSDKSAITINSSADFKEPYHFAIYVAHHINQSYNPNPTWNYFVEKISLQADPYSKMDKSLPITYELIISFPKESWLQLNVMSWFRLPPHQRQIESILNEAQQRLDLFQSCLAKNLTKKAQMEMYQSQNCHPEFKREDKLPAQHYKKFLKIKTQIYSYYSAINKGKKLNRFFLDNLICRYMINKKYDQHETLPALKKYLDWEKMMRSKYSLQYFKEFHQLGIFQYIGKDCQGRPLILFRSDRFIPERIHKQSEYIDYNAYIFEIYVQDQMEGYIDEYSIIGDYRGFSTANFKYSIAKGFSQLSNEYFPERQHRLIIYGINSFGEWIFKVIKPILPSFIIQKIFIYGEDIEPFKQQIKKFMEPKLIIPLLDRKAHP